MNHPIPVRIPDDLQAKLKQEASKEGLSMSAVIRRIIIRHCSTKSRKSAA